MEDNVLVHFDGDSFRVEKTGDWDTKSELPTGFDHLKMPDIIDVAGELVEIPEACPICGHGGGIRFRVSPVVISCRDCGYEYYRWIQASKHCAKE